MGIFKREWADFYHLLRQQTRKVKEGVEALVAYMKDPTPARGELVIRLEEEADVLRKKVVDELNRAFVTPIDREDIYALSRAVDDIIDTAESTVEEMMAFDVHPEEHHILMAQGVCEGMSALFEAISALPKDRARAEERIVFAKKRENDVEHLYREGLVDLFKNKDVVTVLKLREIYRHLSSAANHADEAANIIGNILVKSL